MNTFRRIKPPVYPVERVVIPEPERIFLNNGVPIFLIEAGTEDIMRVEFTFGAGMVKEYLPLMASTTNMMLTEGSQNYTSEELNRLLDYFGVFHNLYTEKDRAGIVYFFPANHLKKVMELSKEILFKPVFPAAELTALMKKRIRWYLVNREKVQNLASDKFFESVFGSRHTYGYQVTEHDFERLNPALLIDFHSKYYTHDNMAVIISGRIHKKTIEILNYYFGDLNSKILYKEDAVKFLKGGKKKKVHVNKKGSVQTAVRIGSSTINKRHKDYPGLKVLNTILGGYFGSRLMRNIREEKGYTYGIGSSITSLDLSGYKIISAEVSKKNCQKAIDEIYREIGNLQHITVGRDEISLVRNYMSGEMLRMFDGPFALAESFKSVWEFGLDNSYYYTLAEKIKTIDQDEIKELARTYYNINDLYEVTVGSR